MEISDLEKKGFVNVTYPPELRAAVERASVSWRLFCSLPKDVRTQFPYHPETGMGVGYEIKEVMGKSLDLKEDFNLTLASRDWLQLQAQNCNEPCIVRFVEDALALIEIMRPTVEEFARLVESRLKVDGFGNDIAHNSNHWFIRFLHYFGGATEVEEIATAHTDKSAFTLHLHESAPGLQRLTRSGKWVDMCVSKNETVIIPGMRLQYRSENRLKATFHRVVANSTTAKEGRFSAVCFVHPKNTWVYDKKRAGRLQEFDPGFNYNMPWEEFRALFRPE